MTPVGVKLLAVAGIDEVEPLSAANSERSSIRLQGPMSIKQAATHLGRIGFDALLLYFDALNSFNMRISRYII